MHATTLTESTLRLALAPQGPASPNVTLLEKAAGQLAPYHRRLSRIDIRAARYRRSARGHAAMHAEELAALLRLACLDTAAPGKRPYPAAGALYCVHVFVAVRAVEGLASGVHQLRVSEGSLEHVAPADTLGRLARSAALHPDHAEAPAWILLVADTRLARVKYRDRAWRLAMIEGGCLVQTLGLAATHLGLSTCPLGGISDRAALDVCALPPEAEAAFVCGMAVGGGETSH